MNGVALKVYNLLWRLSKKSKSKTGAISITNLRIAKLVGAREGKRADYITRVKMALDRAGWLRFEGVSKAMAGTWTGGRYVVISHEDWSRRKGNELGYSPCQPDPVQVQVCKVKPGGRGYKSKREVRTVEALEVRTADSADFAVHEPHRAGQEVRTECVVGSTSTVRSGKYAQSVDFPTVDIETTGDATAAMPPVAVPDMPDGNSQEEDAKYAQRIAELKEQAMMMLQKYGQDKAQAVAA